VFQPRELLRSVRPPKRSLDGVRRDGTSYCRSQAESNRAIDHAPHANEGRLIRDVIEIGRADRVNERMRLQQEVADDEADDGDEEDPRRAPGAVDGGHEDRERQQIVGGQPDQPQTTVRLHDRDHEQDQEERRDQKAGHRRVPGFALPRAIQDGRDRQHGSHHDDRLDRAGISAPVEEDQEEKDRAGRNHVAGDLGAADTLTFAGVGQLDASWRRRYVEPPGHRPALPDVLPSVRLLVRPHAVTTGWHMSAGHVVERWQAVERWRVVWRGRTVGWTRWGIVLHIKHLPCLQLALTTARSSSRAERFLPIPLGGV